MTQYTNNTQTGPTLSPSDREHILLEAHGNIGFAIDFAYKFGFYKGKVEESRKNREKPVERRL